MKECCSNCRSFLNLEKLDYSRGGCEHTRMEGFICIAVADEGIADWMVGLDPDTEMCECWEERK